jgi:hypothetical protein
VGISSRTHLGEYPKDKLRKCPQSSEHSTWQIQVLRYWVLLLFLFFVSRRIFVFKYILFFGEVLGSQKIDQKVLLLPHMDSPLYCQNFLWNGTFITMDEPALKYHYYALIR